MYIENAKDLIKIIASEAYKEGLQHIPFINSICNISLNISKELENRRIKEIIERVIENNETISKDIEDNYEYIYTSKLMINAAINSKKQERFEVILNLYENFIKDYNSAKDEIQKNIQSDMYEFYLDQILMLKDIHFILLEELHKLQPNRKVVYYMEGAAWSPEIEKKHLDNMELLYNENSKSRYIDFQNKIELEYGLYERFIDDNLNYISSTGFCKRIEGVQQLKEGGAKQDYIYITTKLYEEFKEKIIKI